MRHLALAPLLLLLAACATPRQQCERAATRDMGVVSSLIVKTQQNLARGYALKREVRTRSVLQFCYGNTLNDDGDGYVGATFCNNTETYTVETPVAIDVTAEQAKLRSLKAKLVELQQRSAQQLAACAAQYPDA